MKIFIIFSLPAHGHTNPTLSVAAELVAKGHKVIYYSTPEFEAKVKAAGAIYRSYPVDEFVDARISRNMALLGEKIVDFTEQLVDQLIDEVKDQQVDCIIYDAVALWGKVVSTALSIPAATFYTTLAFNKRVIMSNTRVYTKALLGSLLTGSTLVKTMHKYRKLARIYGFKARSVNEFLCNEEACNIVFTSSYFQPYVTSFDASFHFVGSSIQTRNEKTDFIEKLNKQKKIIYISTGTIFNQDLNFYHKCIHAFADKPYQVIMSLGNTFTKKDLLAVPSNFIIKNHIPQLEVLKKADVFITHAGMNSITEALYNSVPMLLVPFTAEQQLNAHRVAQLGAGIFLKKDKVTPDQLHAFTQKVLQDSTYKSNATAIAKTQYKGGGYKKAAEILIAYESTQRKQHAAI